MNLKKTIDNKSLPSFCTANFLVLKTLLIFCKKNKLPALIESTSNQVNQFGGYSNNKPKDFIKKINGLIESLKINKKTIYFGGDHLGPLPWKNYKSSFALKNSIKLIDLYLKANYQKIHIDTSIQCKDDKLITDKKIFARTEYILKNLINKKKLKKIFFVFGTEVPFAGGNDKKKFKITENNKIIADYQNFSKLLNSEKLSSKDFALVIEPGMKFKNNSITKPKFKSFEINKKFSKKNKFYFEAHSTDYQDLETLNKLVKNNFKILKVGPELTYNLVKSFLFMQKIEKIFLRKKSNFRKIIIKKMFVNNLYWKDFFKKGSKKQLEKNLLNSFYDRTRYYLSNNDVMNSIKILEININKIKQEEIIRLLKKETDKKNITNLKNFKNNNFQHIISAFLDRIFLKYYKACGFNI
jgi:D-tagatose-1,6-bisphosphate aldolase subunit GatZ/KbaZ